MVDFVFFALVFAAMMLVQIVVEAVKAWIGIRAAKAQTEAMMDAVFSKLGNFALAKLLRKGGGPDEV